VRLPSALSLAVVAGLLVLAPALATAPAAYAVECPVVAYPGDAAPKPAIAAWMAGGAVARGIPGELPVMAALVESGLQNLESGDADSKGYFQMREGIWGGTYPGFPDDPELQLDWFLDQAANVRTPPYPDESAWGEWVADVQRPAAQNRGRYQLRLDEARLLIAQGCSAPDTSGPVTQVRTPARQQALAGAGVRVVVGCPAEQCTVEVRGRVLLGGRPRLTVPLATLAPGQRATFNLALKPGARRLVTQALERHQRVRVDVTVMTTDASGNADVVERRVRVIG
jgi:hypothetical protein